MLVFANCSVVAAAQARHEVAVCSRSREDGETASLFAAEYPISVLPQLR